MIMANPTHIYEPWDLPDLRHRLYTDPRMPGAFARAASLVVEKLGAGDVAQIVGGSGAIMCTAPLHYIDHRFGDLIAAAAPSLPLSALAEHDLPTPTGLAYFNPAGWIALWGPLEPLDDEGDGAPGVGAWWLRPREPDEDPKTTPIYVPSKSNSVLFGADISASLREADLHGDPEEPGSGFGHWLLRYLLTTWHLQRQRLTTTRIVRPPRATLRRMTRDNDTSDPEVRVVTLRAPDSQSGSGVSDREFHHRWIVRGHWRQQWYPSIQDHRPVWITPHLKGPEDAPLLGGEKVYRWNR
jgi:hypothetical protein